MGVDFPGSQGGGSGGGIASANYIVTDVGGAPGVINGRTGTSIGTYASYGAAVNAALAATTSPITIWLDPRYVDNETGTITISRGKVSIYSGLHVGMETGSDWFTGMQPAFQKITIDSSSAEIRNVYLQGISLREINLYGKTNAISSVTVDRCGFYPTTATSTKGINFTGDHLTNYIQFNDCWMLDACATGGIEFSNTASTGNGQYQFNQFHYKPYTANATMAVWYDDIRTDQWVVFHELDHVNTGQTGHIWFKFHSGSKQKGLRVVNSNFEEHVSTTIFSVDAGSTHQLRWIDFSHNQGSLGDSDHGHVETLTFIDNSAANADYVSYSQSYLMGHMNKFTGDSGGTNPPAFSLGTTGACTRFIFDVGYTSYIGTVAAGAVMTTG